MKSASTDNHKERTLLAYYSSMYERFGSQGWWPGRTRFEVIVGAILTQNTSWTNVEKAIRNLKSAGVLTHGKMHALGVKELSELIRPAGYFNIKARRIKNFTDHLFTRNNGSLDKLLNKKALELRAELLSINGIGPETADSIVLYAARLPEFVVDAYTRRIFARHGLIRTDAGYEELKSLFSENLKPDTPLFNEYHALIVKTGKDFCKTRNPLCEACPLEEFLYNGA